MIMLLAGVGEAAFRDASVLPERGYAPRFERFDDDWVYAVRLRDGRLAKVWVRGPSDVRDALELEVVLLKGGGREIAAGPSDVTASWDGKSMKLSWRGPAATYVVRCGEKEVARTRELSAELRDAEPHAFVKYSVTAIDADGAASDSASVEAHTFPPHFRVGVFELQVGSESFRFSDGAVVAARDGDMVITNSAGGASSLGIEGSHGIESGVGTFGRIDSRELVEALAQKDVDTDDRRPATMSFRVKTSEGGMAHVRIVGANYPKVRFQYVYLAKPDVPTMVKELAARAKAPGAEEAAEIGRHVAALEAEDVREREEAQAKLVAKGAAAIRAVLDAYEKEKSAERRGRLEAVIRRLWEKR